MSMNGMRKTIICSFYNQPQVLFFYNKTNNVRCSLRCNAMLADSTDGWCWWRRDGEKIYVHEQFSKFISLFLVNKEFSCLLNIWVYVIVMLNNEWNESECMTKNLLSKFKLVKRLLIKISALDEEKWKWIFPHSYERASFTSVGLFSHVTRQL